MGVPSYRELGASGGAASIGARDEPDGAAGRAAPVHGGGAH